MSGPEREIWASAPPDPTPEAWAAVWPVYVAACEVQDIGGYVQQSRLSEAVRAARVVLGRGEEAPPASTPWQEIGPGIYQRADVAHQIQVASDFGDRVKRADEEQP